MDTPTFYEKFYSQFQKQPATWQLNEGSQENTEEKQIQMEVEKKRKEKINTEKGNEGERRSKIYRRV